MVSPVVLTDPVARDPAHVGVKAARLAAAAAAGLPVLEGRVLPSEASWNAIRRGVEALETGAGTPAAYLEAMDSAVPSVEELVPRPKPDDRFPDDRYLVVRSSTVLDDDGRWSGAFASYLRVSPSDLHTAVRGCWASAFTADAVGRCRETAVQVGDLRIGVLVQPFLAFDVGGTARVREDGTVAVTAALGGPAGVVGGRGGVEAIVGVDGRAVAGLDDSAIGAGPVEAAAALARRAAETLAAGVIEWGVVGDEVSLLQIGPTAPAQAGVATTLRATEAVPMPDDAERLARLVTHFPGRLGDELVLPWAFGMGELPEADEIRLADPLAALREARTSAGELAAEVWGAAPSAARERAAGVSRLLLTGRVSDGCREIRDLPAPDPAVARRVVALIHGLGAWLADAGILPSGSLVWGLTVSELERAVAGTRPPLRRGPGRWEPFVADVVRARGVHATGRPVSPGIAAGHLHPLRELRAMGRPAPRDVLVTPLPLPHLAPLLWHSAALVSVGGSSGSHLFEVARSLGVPSVIGVDPIFPGERGSLVAVDGDDGVVSILPPGGASSWPSHDDARAMA
jgi:phosphohistidine swiveling domain-containing protein